MKRRLAMALLAAGALAAALTMPTAAQAFDQPANRAAELQALLDSVTKLDATAWSMKRSGNLVGCHAAVTVEGWVDQVYTWRFKGTVLPSGAC